MHSFLRRGLATVGARACRSRGSSVAVLRRVCAAFLRNYVIVRRFSSAESSVFVSEPRRLRSQPATSSGPGHPPDTAAHPDHDDDDNGGRFGRTEAGEKQRRLKKHGADKRRTDNRGRRSTGDCQAGPVRPPGGLKLIRDEVNTWTSTVHEEFVVARQ